MTPNILLLVVAVVNLVKGLLERTGNKKQIKFTKNHVPVQDKIEGSIKDTNIQDIITVETTGHTEEKIISKRMMTNKGEYFLTKNYQGSSVIRINTPVNISINSKDKNK